MKHSDRLRLYTAGLTDKEIAEKLGDTIGAIVSWRNGRGLSPNGPGKVPDKAKHVRRKKLWQKGLTDREMAQIEDVHVTTISNWRYKNGLKVNRESKKSPLPKQKKQVEPQCITCAKATAITCSFMASNDPVAGLRATGVKPSGVEVHTSTSGKVYRVTNCPRYKRGPLPSITREVVGQ